MTSPLTDAERAVEIALQRAHESGYGASAMDTLRGAMARRDTALAEAELAHVQGAHGNVLKLSDACKACGGVDGEHTAVCDVLWTGTRDRAAAKPDNP